MIALSEAEVGMPLGVWRQATTPTLGAHPWLPWPSRVMAWAGGLGRQHCRKQ